MFLVKIASKGTSLTTEIMQTVIDFIWTKNESLTYSSPSQNRHSEKNICS